MQIDTVEFLNFDPEGSGYDYSSARTAEMKRDSEGHMGSVVKATKEEIKRNKLPPKSYKLLKGSQHETFPKTIEAERDRGSVVKKGDDGRYYSVPKDKKYSYGGRVAKSSAEKS